MCKLLWALVLRAISHNSPAAELLLRFCEATNTNVYATLTNDPWQDIFKAPNSQTKSLFFVQQNNDVCPIPGNDTIPQGLKDYESLNDEPTHNEVITTNVWKLLDEYGPEKGLEFLQEHMIIEINCYREQRNKQHPDESPLIMLESNTILNTSAQDYADYLYDNNKAWHSADWRTPKDRAEDAGYQSILIKKFRNVRENIAYRQDNIEEVIEAWLNSPIHKENIYAPVNSWQAGVGYAGGNTGGKRVFVCE